MKKIKFNQSAIPYLLLLVVLLIGIPYADQKADEQKSQSITFQVKTQALPIAKCEIIKP